MTKVKIYDLPFQKFLKQVRSEVADSYVFNRFEMAVKDAVVTVQGIDTDFSEFKLMVLPLVKDFFDCRIVPFVFIEIKECLVKVFP